jgi:peptidoglycan/LPS O-acetylase OafA/YrhL
MGLIRFLLACIVVLCHSGNLPWYSPIPSDLAVQCFYVISGFYMALILNEKYPKGSHSLFYTNRALKIYPIYWINLILLVIWGVVTYQLGYPGTIWFYAKSSPLSLFTWCYFIIANLFIIGLDLTFVLGIKDGQLYFTDNFGRSNPNVYLFGFNSIAWTVGVELIFYIIAPFILRKRFFIPLLLLILSLSIRVAFYQFGLQSHPWDYMFFPTQLMFFMGGCLSYHLYKFIKKVNKPHLNKYLYALLFSVIMFYSYLFNNSFLSQAILFIALIVLIPSSFLVTKNSKADRYLGNLSYPVYISQMLVISATRAHAFPKPLGFGGTTLLLVLIISIILEYCVSRPIENYRQRRISDNT